jgi:hypothetical protein
LGCLNKRKDLTATAFFIGFAAGYGRRARIAFTSLMQPAMRLAWKLFFLSLTSFARFTVDTFPVTCGFLQVDLRQGLFLLGFLGFLWPRLYKTGQANTVLWNKISHNLALEAYRAASRLLKEA